MKFAYPEFLYALSAIAIPIIIHLFNFRKYKKLYFSNVEFLKDIQQETQSKSKLKHLLILFSRILAISFLVFAFAQPYIPTSDNTISNQGNIVSVYIDNSFSMESIGDNGSLLNDAKTKAKDIVSAYQSSDKFILTTNNFDASEQRTLSQEEILDKIDFVSTSTKTRTISQVYSRVRDAVNSNDLDNKSSYFISDFQKTTTDLNQIQSDSTIDSYLVKVNAQQVNNLYIDSCWFSSLSHVIGQNEELNVRIKNNADNDLENIPLKLYINEQQIAPASFSVKANGETQVKLNYRNKTSGIQHGKIELRDHPITTDDIFYFSYQLSSSINILGIGPDNENSALSSVFSTDSIFNYTHYNIGQLDYSLIKKSNLIVIYHLDEISSGLASSLKSFTDNGGSLLLFPSDRINYNSYREFLSLMEVNYYESYDTSKTKVKGILLEHPIYENVFEGKPDGNIDLPVVSSHYPLSRSNTKYKSEVLKLKNGNSFLTEYKIGKGSVYLCSSSLKKESSNFSSHAIFVPTMYNIAMLSQSTYPLYHVIGSSSSIDLIRSEKDDIYHLKNKNVDIIPQIRSSKDYTTVFVASSIHDQGNYELQNNLISLGVAFNLNRSESDLTCLTNDEVAAMLESGVFNATLIDSSIASISSSLNELNIGKEYWKYCIILALIFLAAEIILIKLFK